MNNAGMDGYSYQSEPSHGETKPYGPPTRESLGHGLYQTLWARDDSFVMVECYCGFRTRSRLLSIAMGNLTVHEGHKVVAATARKIGAEAMSA